MQKDEPKRVGKTEVDIPKEGIKFDGLVKNPLDCHPDESRGPERRQITRFPLAPD
jgi:hypothetical protein